MEEKVKELEQEITKWKFKYNSRNAEYVLLYQEFADYKKRKIILPWLLALLIVAVIYLTKYHD